MKAFDATDAKNRFGELLDAATREPVLLTRNGAPIAYVIPAEPCEPYAQARSLLELKKAIAEDDRKTIDILRGFSIGRIPRRRVMKDLGLSWYGDLIEALSFAGLPLPAIGKSERQKMAESFVRATRG